MAPHLDVAAVNISAGYYNEHRQHEYVRLDQMEENISRVREIVLTNTERFAYRGLYSSPSTGSFWGEEMTLWNMRFSSRKEPKPLMELPDNARLMMGSHEMGGGRSHYIDRKGNVYLYLHELGAAVLIDGACAYSDTGEQLSFDSKLAQDTRIMEYDEAMELLRAG